MGGSLGSWLMGTEFQFARWRVLEMDGGDDCIKTWMFWMPLNCVLKNGWNGKFYVIYTLSQLKNTISLEASNCRKAGAEPSKSSSLQEEWLALISPTCVMLISYTTSWWGCTGWECWYIPEQGQAKLSSGHFPYHFFPGRLLIHPTSNKPGHGVNT